MQATHRFGEMSRRRDFFILLAHGKVITNIAQDTHADFWLIQNN